MAITKRTAADRLEIDRDGNIGIRLTLEVFEDNEIFAKQNYRLTVAKNGDIAAAIAIANAAATARGYPPVGAGVTNRIISIANAAWA